MHWTERNRTWRYTGNNRRFQSCLDWFSRGKVFCLKLEHNIKHGFPVTSVQSNEPTEIAAIGISTTSDIQSKVSLEDGEASQYHLPAALKIQMNFIHWWTPFKRKKCANGFFRDIIRTITEDYCALYTTPAYRST
jgi:hypothetical protein